MENPQPSQKISKRWYVFGVILVVVIIALLVALGPLLASTDENNKTEESPALGNVFENTINSL